MRIEVEQEEDGRWIAEAPPIPGGVGCGESKFHDADEIEPRMLARIAKHTGLAPEDL